jgi:prolipoprotein diacylglyceryltransferase
MLTTKKSVLLVEGLKLVLGIVLVSIVWTTSRINPTLVGKIVGVAGLLYGAYFFFRALYQKDHSNVLLRLRGDDRRIPTTEGHRALNLVLAAGMIICGFALLFRV